MSRFLRKLTPEQAAKASRIRVHGNREAIAHARRNHKVVDHQHYRKPQLAVMPRPVLIKSPAEKDMAKADIQPASLLRKQTFETTHNSTTSRNFPENELQLNKHYAAVAQAGPNPADTFR